MMGSRTKHSKGAKGASASGAGGKDASKENKPDAGELVETRNYQGLYTLLEFQLAEAAKAGDNALRMEKLKWMAFAKFHLGDYDRSIRHYDELLALGPAADEATEINLFKACSLFYDGEFEDAAKIAEAQSAHPLRQRLLFHIAQKRSDEEQLREYHKQLTSESIEDELSLASMHFLRSHFQEAIDVYKHILLEHRLYIALNVYIALCYYKLDYYDVSQEVLDVYLRANSTSAVALNLKGTVPPHLFCWSLLASVLERLTPPLLLVQRR
jgi:intraflagellar transport protein 56